MKKQAGVGDFLKGLMKTKGGVASATLTGSKLESAAVRSADRALIKANPIGGYTKPGNLPSLNSSGGLQGGKVPTKTLQQARAERFAKMRGE